jgi:hypothetical protein
MMMKIRHPWDALRELIADPARTRHRELTSDKQIRLAWARLAETYEDVPDVYRPFYDSLAPEQRNPFPYTVITPTYKGFLTPQNEKLLCRMEDNLFLLEQIHGRLIETCYPLQNIFRIETGTILLHSWMTIDGMDPRGVPASTSFSFNSVSEPLLATFVEAFRAAVAGPAAEAGTEPDLTVFDPLGNTHFKFKNYGRKTVRPGEKVIQVLMQPELRKRYSHIAGFTLSRQIAPTHMIILTDREFILIREDESRRWGQENRYGGIWNYVPLRKISSVSLRQREDEILVLTIHLPQTVQLDVPYPVSRRTEVMKLHQRIRAEING